MGRLVTVSGHEGKQQSKLRYVTATQRVWYIRWCKKMAQPLIGNKFLSGLFSLMIPHTSQLQHVFSQFSSFQLNLRINMKMPNV